ncbi:MAG: protein kinase, partial [Pirellulales bacterium]|nr:protein kinase [Pirellulales bacterium]
MNRCPKCSAILSESQFEAGICPTCHATWSSDERPRSASKPMETLQPADFVPPDRVVEPSEGIAQPPKTFIPPDHPIDELSGTTDAQAALVSASEPSRDPMEKPTGRGKETARPNLDETVTQDSIDSKKQPSSQPGGGGKSSSGSAAWQGGPGRGVSPMNTLKGPDIFEIHEEGLVIRTRRLQPQDAPGAEEADYKIIREIGKGGMGRVHLAVQTALNRRVAVKELDPKTAHEPQNRRKFLAEATITGELDHPNIVPIHDVGLDKDGRLFYSMKMISGQEWQTRIASNSRSQNLDILMKVADAVSFAHARNVIHRDLKPENVMLGGFGEVLVTDWGLAVHLGSDQGFVAGGTPCYMAPEMAADYIKGESERNPNARDHFQTTLSSDSLALVEKRLAPIDKRSDIYLLGAILFHTATGGPPHTGNSISECLARAVANEVTIRVSDDELITIAQKAMATEPIDRYPSVDSLQQAIREYQRHHQSISLSARAQDDLDTAKTDGNYEWFQRAMFGFQEAADLWPENRQAVEGVQQAKLAYAQRALELNDFDLGLQLLNPNVLAEQDLHQQFVKGARDRDLRIRRFKIARTTVVCLFLMLLGLGVKYWADTIKSNEKLRVERDRAIDAEANAKVEEQ